MLLPLSACPAAPAQGALAIECRRDDVGTGQRLSAIDDAATRGAVAAERALLAQRGGGCHQRFGATQLEVAGLGTLLYVRDSDAAGQALPVVPPQWTPEPPLPVPPSPAQVRAWDGSRVAPGAAEDIAEAAAALRARLRAGDALFVTHRRALPASLSASDFSGLHLWVPGIETWQALAARGLWVEGCADGLGIAWVAPLLRQPMLQLPDWAQWTVLTHADAALSWSGAQVLATYAHRADAPAPERSTVEPGPTAETTHVYWHSGAQFERWHARLAAGVQHACGAGRTAEHLQRAGVQNLRLFPQVALWRQWLGL
jgi:hydroxymethylbilane synthase